MKIVLILNGLVFVIKLNDTEDFMVVNKVLIGFGVDLWRIIVLKSGSSIGVKVRRSLVAFSILVDGFGSHEHHYFGEETIFLLFFHYIVHSTFPTIVNIFKNLFAVSGGVLLKRVRLQGVFLKS